MKSATSYTPTLFRPPYGAIDARVAGLAASQGLRSVIWDVDPRDWSLPGVGWIVSNVLANAHPGAIVIMHDGGGNRSETVAALPAILAGLRARHLQTATVSQLLGLPDAQLCDTRKAATIFARDGAHAHPTHAIFNAWSDQLCRGVSLGPATSGERVTRKNVVSQDFDKTGHRISWHEKTGAVVIHVVWIDAYRAFSAHGIRPRYGSPITTAWLQHFFAGHSWGPALKAMYVRGRFSMQTFAHGNALAWGRKVQFRPRRT